jgi:ferrochelatase
MPPKKKIAVLLFSLGAPNKLSAVKPFLYNLFNDPAITGMPSPFRQLLAAFISSKRAPEARKIYAHIGGASPLLPNTQKQADALQKILAEQYPDSEFLCTPVMRYWNPRAKEIAKQIQSWKPDTIVFLPMYPQFSTTTNRSSMKEMHQALNKLNVSATRRLICCFPNEDGFIKASVNAILPLIKEAHDKGFQNPRLLLSAHGVPKKIISSRGDPYQKHCEISAQNISDALKNQISDTILCYQSRVGPLEWLRPYTEDIIKNAGKEKKALIIFPLAFVSEHSETLVELDIEYRELAEESGVPLYLRAPAVAENTLFINGLAQLVSNAIINNAPLEDNRLRPTCTLKNHNGNCPKNASECCPLDIFSQKSLAS